MTGHVLSGGNGRHVFFFIPLFITIILASFFTKCQARFSSSGKWETEELMEIKKTVLVPHGGSKTATGALGLQLNQSRYGKNPMLTEDISILDHAYSADRVNLAEWQIRQLCHATREIFLEQPMLLELEAPVNIVGDIHGQYEDLLRHFDKLGFPPQANYLFLGDYVDRGKNSLETICLLLAYKIKYPNNFFLLRGNHECASINRIYGFYDECKRRYSTKLWKTFTDLFNCLPIAALVEGTIFCMHGGLSPQLMDLSQIRNIPRPIDVPDSGLVCDLLWGDPDENVTGWGVNDRGVSFVFGSAVVQNFLAKHDCSLIVRAHQVVEDGYQFFAQRSLLTLFSAPNYCGEFDNAGAVMGVSEDLTCWFSVLPPDKKKTIFKYK